MPRHQAPWLPPLEAPPPLLINRTMLSSPSLGARGFTPAMIPPGRMGQSLVDGYQRAVEAQQRLLNGFGNR